MAEIPEYERQVAGSVFNITPATGVQDVGRALGATAKVFERALSDDLIKKAGERGALEAMSGQTEGKKLPFAFGKAQSAYNDAVSNIEARRAVIDYTKRAEQEFLIATDPSKFSMQTPQTFNKRIDEAKNKYIRGLRPEAQAKAQMHFEQVQADLETKMLGHGIGYHNAAQKRDFQNQLGDLRKQLDTYERTGDKENAALIKEQINQHLNDYSVANEGIKREVPQIRKKLEEESRINNSISEYLDSAREGKEDKFMFDYFRKGPQKDVSYDEWLSTMKEIQATENLRNRMMGEQQAQTMIGVKRGIDSGLIGPDEIMAIDPEFLGATDKMKAISYYEQESLKQAKQNTQVLSDRRHFAEGRGAAVPDSRLNDYFSEAVDSMQMAQDGQPVSLLQMANAIMGQNEYPVSGMKNVPVNSDVPRFNAIMDAQLRNADNPAAVAEAASVWNYMVNTNKSPQSIKISGDALAVAAKQTELSLGSTLSPEQAAQAALDTVLDKSEPKVKAARSRFEKEIKRKIPDYFKKAFGTAPEAFTDDAARTVFEDVFRGMYMSSMSEDAAFNATQSAMASWGTSKFGPKDMVMNHPLEKEFPSLSVGRAAFNQQAIRLQEIINRNEGITWIGGGKKVIDFQSLTDKEKVNANLPHKGPVRFNRNIIEVNGWQSEVEMITDTASGLAADGKFRYYLFYKDRAGELQPIPDEGSPTGQAYWDPVSLDVYAPEIYSEKEGEKMLKDYKAVRREQLKEMMKASSSFKFIPKDITSAVIVEMLEKGGEINEEAARKFFKKEGE